MSKLQYPSTQIIKDKFQYLENYGFNLTREENLNYGSYLEFKGKGIKICLNFEFKSYSFSVDIYKSEDLQYSDAAYGKEIISLCDIAKRNHVMFDCNKLQPNKEAGFDTAIDYSANLLMQLGKEIYNWK